MTPLLAHPPNIQMYIIRQLRLMANKPIENIFSQTHQHGFSPVSGGG